MSIDPQLLSVDAWATSGAVYAVSAPSHLRRQWCTCRRGLVQRTLLQLKLTPLSRGKLTGPSP